MGFSPKDAAEKAQRIITAWETLRPESTFGGMTLNQFKTAVKPSFDLRDELDTIEAQRKTKIDQRNDADKATLSKIELAVNGVKADPAEGSDSELLEGFGYTRKSERKSGLTRKKASNGNGQN